jgi:hypothetical protein
MANRWISNLFGTKLAEFWVNRARFLSSGLTANRTFTLPDVAGTIALTSDIGSASDLSTVISSPSTIEAGKVRTIGDRYTIDDRLKIDGKLVVI